ncbi:RING-H2 finger protein ATL58-like [Drosophila eugracilis]|uniref:RING-H2 finger protein ATL58-like n=1 Tax=Drosophila eugracilis TaxID=29029 RepID=UPI0007E63D51|nr:RING-H2 finger protein ATL58-like [Drosophila eugracilis]
MDVKDGKKLSLSFGVTCAICTEFYAPYDVIYSSAKCGHIFHKSCLRRWLTVSMTCPQCRASCHKESTSRIYLNFCNTEDLQDKKPIQWVPLNYNTKKLPEGVVRSGFDEMGNSTYVARAYMNDDMLPAGYVARNKSALCSWDCQAYKLCTELEVLVLAGCDYKWVAGTKGSYPADALQTGYTEDGEVTYTGRGLYKGIMRLGKVHPSHGVMYLPYDDLEVNILHYEVLVVIPR